MVARPFLFCYLILENTNEFYLIKIFIKIKTENVDEKNLNLLKQESLYNESFKYLTQYILFNLKHPS